MSKKPKKQPRIHIERGAPDRILPKHFGKILTRRFFPVLSLTYISSVIGMAFNKGDLQKYLLDDHIVFFMALLAALWVSVPAILWIILKGSHLFNHVANIWYWICAFSMSATLGISYILIPEADMYGYEIRTYFVASIPMTFVMYYFCAKQPFSKGISYTLILFALLTIIYGVSLKFYA